MTQVLRCRLRALSPVHVGCDEVYEPTGFVVDEQGGTLVAFDPLDFMDVLDAGDRNRFSAICAKGDLGSLIEIYKFMRGRRIDGNRVAVCPGFVSHYQDSLKKLNPQNRRQLQSELNSFAVLRTAFETVSQRPYLPGSAVKGSLRTAYLNHLAQGRAVFRPEGDRPKDKARSLERTLLEARSFDTDPLRMVKVSDFAAVGAATTRVIYAVNRSKKPAQQDQPRPYQILEVIEAGTEFVGTISVESPPNGAGITRALDLRLLQASANRFFGAELERERNELANIGANGAIQPPSNGAILLRIGRHSGAESVTIARYRDIKIMQGRNPARRDDHATSIWLAATSRKPQTNKCLQPFGWVALEEISAQELTELEQQETQRRQSMELNPRGPSAAANGSSGGDEVSAAELKPEPAPASIPPERIVWEAAMLSWNAGNQELTATWQGVKAFVKGRDILPETLRERLCAKKKKAKPVTAKVVVEAIGNAFAIVEVAAD